MIRGNISLIEDAVDDPVKEKQLEADLGIVKEALPEVVLMSD